MSSLRKYLGLVFKNFWRLSFLSVFISIAIGIFLCVGILKVLFFSTETHIPSGKALVLSVNLEGVILDSYEFLTNLRTHIQKDRVKAVIIRVNSPGGAVGPSQAIYSEIISLREEFKKPIIMSLEAVAASGAYYVSVGADKIVANPGTLMGSIGVIMNFANLENLYDWAKIKPYTLKTGKFKDTGTVYRSMTAEERRYMQALLEEVLEQFKSAIVEGRQLEASLVDENADGRVFTGARAVELGFADQIGNYSDAIALAEELAGVEKLEVFEPKEPLDFMSYLKGLESLWSGVRGYSVLIPHPSTPMYLMPSF